MDELVNEWLSDWMIEWMYWWMTEWWNFQLLLFPNKINLIKANQLKPKDQPAMTSVTVWPLPVTLEIPTIKTIAIAEMK